MSAGVLCGAEGNGKTRYCARLRVCYAFDAKMLAVVPTIPSTAPITINTELIAIVLEGAFVPSCLAFICKALMYIIGGKTNIMLDPSTPPATEPTTPMSVNFEARRDMSTSSRVAIRFTPPICGMFLTACVTNQLRMERNIRGKLASTDVPKANLARVPRGSRGEKELRAKEADLEPNSLRPRATVPM